MRRPSIALFLPTLEGGGAERVFVQLANQFAEWGRATDLVLANAQGPYIDEVSSRIRVVDLGAASVLRSVPGLVRYLRRARPGVVCSGLDHANVAAVAARAATAAGIRCVLSVRAVPTAVYEHDRSVSRWALMQLTRIAYRLADAVIANSRGAATDLSTSLRVPGEKLQVIYNPLNVGEISRLSSASADHEWLDGDAPPLLLSVGSLTRLKDFGTLIRAFAIVRKTHECRLAILGEGPQRRLLQNLASDLDLDGDVLLPGFVGNPFPWMKKAKVFVSSSLTEGCPNALMQALACNTAVVSTDSPGGAREILQHGRWGRLVPVGDPDSMAGAILEAMGSADGINGEARAKDFELEKIAAQYLHVLLPAAESKELQP